MGTGVEIAGLVLAVGGTAKGVHEQRKAARSSRRAALARDRINALKEQKALTQSVREGRIKRAAVEAIGETTGAAGSSGVLGGMSSIQSQLGSNLGYFGQLRDETDVFDAAMSSAAKRQEKGQMWGNVANIGSWTVQNSDRLSSTGKGLYEQFTKGV